jgi:hypothetical protein
MLLITGPALQVQQPLLGKAATAAAPGEALKHWQQLLQEAHRRAHRRALQLQL